MSSPESPRVPASDGRVMLVCVALACLAVLPLVRVVDFDFVTLDDQLYVQGNPWVNRGLTWDGFTWAFRTFHATNWHPLTWLSHMLDAELFGTTASGPHLVNVLLHAANALLLFACVRSATRTLWPAAFVAALFAVHPLHVESVAWISERKDVLSTLLWFATTLAWIRWTRNSRRGTYVLALLLFALALMAKPMPMTLPITLLLLDVWPLERLRAGAHSVGALVVEKLPFFALSVASAVLTWLAQSTRAASTLDDVTLGERSANAVVSCGTYLWKAIWPADLCAFYPHPALESARHPAWKILVCAAVLAAISTAAWAWRRKRPWFAWGWCWYLVTLVPVIGLVQVGQQARADRYTYVPLVGVFVLIVFGLAHVVEQHRLSRRVVSAVAGVVLGVLACLSWIQSAQWRNGITLYERCVALHPRSALAWSSLGDAQLAQGTPDRTLDAYRRALAIDASEPRATLGMGVALARSGRVDEALPLLERAVHLAPRDANAWYNLGAVQGNLGRHAEARKAFEATLELAPEHEDALAALCFALRSMGDEQGALAAAERLARSNPARGAEMKSLIAR